MRIACAGYRPWALSIYDALAEQTDHEFLMFRSRTAFSEKQLRAFSPDHALFYGWSWRVPAGLVRDVPCIMLHPAPLPRYRGGSPLQNQIIRGETESVLTLFLMDEGLDSGPILASKPFSLSGELEDIFDRITRCGIELTLNLLREGLHPRPQRHEEATCFPRRTPAQSEITPEELRSEPARYLHDKVRMLQEPYPPPFIRTADGRKLVLLKTRIEN